MSDDAALLQKIAADVGKIGARQLTGGRAARDAEKKLREDLAAQLGGLRSDLEAHVDARVAAQVAPLLLKIEGLEALAKAPPTWASWAHAHPQAIIFLLTILAGALGLFGVKLPGSAEPPPAIVQPGAGSLLRGEEKLAILGGRS